MEKNGELSGKWGTKNNLGKGSIEIVLIKEVPRPTSCSSTLCFEAMLLMGAISMTCQTRLLPK